MNYLKCGSLTDFRITQTITSSVRLSSRLAVRLIFKTCPLLQFSSDIFQIHTGIKYDITNMVCAFFDNLTFFLFFREFLI